MYGAKTKKRPLSKAMDSKTSKAKKAVAKKYKAATKK